MTKQLQLLQTIAHSLLHSSHWHRAAASIQALAPILSQLRTLQPSTGILWDLTFPLIQSVQASFHLPSELHSDKVLLTSANMVHRQASTWAQGPIHSHSRELKQQALSHPPRLLSRMTWSHSAQQHLLTLTIQTSQFWRLCKMDRWYK